MTHCRVAIIGTGFSGLGMAMRLKADGMDDFVVLERAGDVGGTWRDNTYPGAACDVPSNLYSFSGELNPDWSHSFSRQPQIQAYLQGCARRANLEPHLRLHHDVLGAEWDEAAARWQIETSQGPFTAHVLIAGSGGLSDPSVPAIPGLDSFAGTTFHSATWDHDHDLAGERVAVIGTGASAIQFVPQIQPRVGRLHLFQRTPPWIIPRTDRPLSRLERRVYRAVPAVQRLVRAAIYWGRESYVVGFTKHRGFMKVPELLARVHLRRQVPDPELRAKLTPGYDIGCKRILISGDYYPALTRDNVEVVTDGIREVCAHSIVTADGTERPIDTIIFGTGFQINDPPIAARVRDRDGVSLAETWKDGTEAYLGTTVAGFPNLFFLAGPNSGLAHTSMTVMIEGHVAYVAGALREMAQRDLATVEIRPEVQAAYNENLQRAMEGTVWTDGGCASWYLDAQGRNRTLWPTFTFDFRRRTERFAPADYELTPAAEPVPAAA